MGLNAFLIPNKIAAGGVSGLATILYYVAKDAGVTLPVGVSMLVMNLGLLVFALRLLADGDSRRRPYMGRWRSLLRST